MSVRASVRPLVTLFFVRRTSYRRKSPFGFGFFLIDRARSLVVHHLVWDHMALWFGRGAHWRDRPLRPMYKVWAKMNRFCAQNFYSLDILFRSDFFCV